MAKIDTETAISANMLSSISTHSITHSLNFLVLFVFLSLFFFTLYLSLSLSLSAFDSFFFFFWATNFRLLMIISNYCIFLTFGLLFWILVNKWENVKD